MPQMPQMPPGLQEILIRNLAPGMQDQELPPEALQESILRNIAMEKSGADPFAGQMPTAVPEQMNPQLGEPQQMPVAQPGPAGNLGEPMQTPVDTTDKAAAIRQLMEQNAAGYNPFPGAGDQFNKPIGILEQSMGNLRNMGITAASAGTIPPGLIDLIRGKGQ